MRTPPDAPSSSSWASLLCRRRYYLLVVSIFQRLARRGDLNSEFSCRHQHQGRGDSLSSARVRGLYVTELTGLCLYLVADAES